jgi:hypothetical protein
LLQTKQQTKLLVINLRKDKEENMYCILKRKWNEGEVVEEMNKTKNVLTENWGVVIAIWDVIQTNWELAGNQMG